MRQFLKCDLGSTAAEYALILAVIGVAVGGASLVLAKQINTSIVSTGNAIHDAGNG